MTLPKSMAADALVTAIDGGRVGIFTHASGDARKIMQELVDEYPELREVSELRWVNGAQSITFLGGGCVDFRVMGHGFRAEVFDRCYVPIGSDMEYVNGRIRPCLATSTDGTLTGY